MTTHARRSIPLLASFAVALAVAVAVAVVAVPAGGAAKMTLRSVRSAALGHNVVATPGGRTLYHRTRETTRHFLCTKSCATIWPPLTVSSKSVQLVKGTGVHGTLGKVRRPDGRLQVTLNGLPLYRFSDDHRTGDANGEGIAGEGTGGGTWHSIRATTPKTTSPPTTSPPPPTYPPYTY
jgi:predicted lipoprotein with Yx(FWY)xxD motif